MDEVFEEVKAQNSHACAQLEIELGFALVRTGTEVGLSSALLPRPQSGSNNQRHDSLTLTARFAWRPITRLHHGAGRVPPKLTPQTRGSGHIRLDQAYFLGR